MDFYIVSRIFIHTVSAVEPPVASSPLLGVQNKLGSCTAC